jgi:hypothetical protein
MKKLFLVMLFFGVLIPTKTQDLDSSLLKMMSARCDSDLSEARLLLTTFRDVHNSMEYNIAISSLLASQHATCQQMKSLYPDADGPFASLQTNCKFHLLDLDGLSALQENSGIYRYSPEAVWVITSTMERDVKQFEILRAELREIQQHKQ